MPVMTASTETPAPSAGAAPEHQGLFSRRYQIGLIASLVVINIFNLMDRSLIGILGESIKSDLSLSDTQLGFAAGAAFITVYTLFSLPMARLADRGMRKKVIIFSVLVWCAMTSLVGLVHSFWQLVVMRMGVAVGEAGVLPATQALVSTQISARRRGIAMGMLLFGGAMGSALAPLIGGWATDHVGWRGTFLMIGPIGFLLLPILWFTIKETPAAAAPVPVVGAGSGDPPTTIWMTARYMAGMAPYRMLWVASAFLFVAPGAYLTYAGPFFIRTFSITAGEAGQHIALAFGVGSVGGGLAGGYLFDRFGRGSPGLGLAVPACGALVAAVVALIGWLSGSIAIATTCFMIALFFGSWIAAPNYATAQFLAPANMRSTSAALFNFSLSTGGSLGPLLIGFISDLLQPSLGSKSLGPALCVAAAFQFVGALILLRAAYLMRSGAVTPPRI